MQNETELIIEGNNQEYIEKNQEIILYFFVYAFLGWILETIFCFLTLGKFEKRGFLYGPICPIYGCGAILLLKCIHKKDNKNKYFFEFCMSLIIFTGIEYIVSLGLEMIFGLRWWNYTNEFLNFQGRISLVYSIVWGIMGLVFIEKIHPYIKKKIEKRMVKISNKIVVQLIYGCIFLAILDEIFSIIKYIHI